MRRRRGIMGLNGGAGIPVITATATGNPLTFETDMIKPLKSLVIPLTPIQAAGTPSPDNPLPISGWTGCEINHGEFVTDDVGTLYQGGLSTVNGSTQNTNYRVRSSAISVEAGKTYTIDSNIKYVAPRYYSTNTLTGYIGYDSYQQTPATFTVPDGAITMRLVFAHDIENQSTITPSQVTKHDVYKGNIITLPVAFTDPTTGDPMTIYGGTLTLNEDRSADLVRSVNVYVITGNETWSRRSNTVFRLQNRNTGVGIYKAGNSKCNYFRTTTGYDPSDGYFSVTTGGDITYVSFCAPSFLGTSATACKAKAKELYDNGTPIIFCSNLRTSQTYHFENVGQLIAFLGTNTIWTDTNGTNTATYLKHQS